MQSRIFLFCLLLLPTANLLFAQDVFMTKNGEVHFSSNAPLEMIDAKSNVMSGAVDAKNRTFAFSVPINTFKGFNNGLQQEHFNEKYMESQKFPNATFKGKIIEEADLSANGTYNVRAKGMMNMRGVEVERIIKATVVVNNGKMNVTSKFEIPLIDHKITIPKILNQKIADKVEVKVNANFSPK